MRPGITHIRDAEGETLRAWRTTDRGPYSSRHLTMQRVELWVLHSSGGSGEAPQDVGYTSIEKAEAAAEQYMAEPDGRGITQEWEPDDGKPRPDPLAGFGR